MRTETANQTVLTVARRMAALIVCGIATATLAAEPVTVTSNDVGFTPAAQSTTALVESGLENGKLTLAVNKTAVVTTKSNYKRFSVGQPEVADVTAVGPTTLLVTAKKVGTTQIIVWDENEQSQVIDIAVEFDVAALREEFKKMFPDAPITVEVLNGQVTLKGRVPNLKTAEQAERVAKAYSAQVINFLEVGGGQQIVLHVQFIEMSRAASNELGFRSFFTDGNSTIGNINGPGSSEIGALAGQTGEGTIDSAVTLFGSGNIGGMAFEAFLSALKTNNLARTLAEPNLVAISGEDAEFLAGGEIPIPVPQSSGGGTTITIEYKEFGVRLKYNAVVLGDGRIRLKVNPEVSELDQANAVAIPGSNARVPGLRTRKVHSIVEMNEGQTLALAGLLQRRVDSTNASTPFLGDLPIIGAMFRNVKYQRSETELVIMVTPRLAQAMNPDQVPVLPGANWKYPNEAELFGFGELGGPQGAAKADGEPVAAAAPRFVGPNGFDEAATPEVQPAVATTDSRD